MKYFEFWAANHHTHKQSGDQSRAKGMVWLKRLFKDRNK
jgi:hypothetical protein